MPEQRTARENARLEIRPQRGRNSHQMGSVAIYDLRGLPPASSVAISCLDTAGSASSVLIPREALPLSVVKSFQLLLADPLDGPAGRHKAMPPARSRCG